VTATTVGEEALVAHAVSAATKTGRAESSALPRQERRSTLVRRQTERLDRGRGGASSARKSLAYRAACARSPSGMRTRSRSTSDPAAAKLAAMRLRPGRRASAGENGNPSPASALRPPPEVIP
jgi:hypothetical protein